MVSSCQNGTVLKHTPTTATSLCHHLCSYGQCLLAPNIHLFQDSSHLPTRLKASRVSRRTMCIFHNHYENRNMKRYQKQFSLENWKFHRKPTGQGSVLKSALRYIHFCIDWNLYMCFLWPTEILELLDPCF